MHQDIRKKWTLVPGVERNFLVHFGDFAHDANKTTTRSKKKTSESKTREEAAWQQCVSEIRIGETIEVVNEHHCVVVTNDDYEEER